MVWPPRLRLIAITAAACGGCNLVFGITGGEPGGPGAGGASAGTGTGTVGTGGKGTGGTGSGATGTGGTGTGGTGTGGSVAGLVVAPAQTTLLPQGAIQLTATIGGSPADVTWKVVDVGGGTLTLSGPHDVVYGAPASAGTYHVRATTVLKPVQEATAVINVVAMVPAVTLSTTGELPNATGQGTQSHLAYAQGTGQWWLFDDAADGTSLTTLFSADFMTWQPGAPLALPQGNSGDGRDLTVAYRSLGGEDVVHVSQGFRISSTYGRYHVRAVLGQGQITYGAVQTVNPGGTMGGDYAPDGASTIIMADGLVMDSTGYQYTPSLTLPPGVAAMNVCGTGDVIVYTSSVEDQGGTSFDGAMFGSDVLWCVPGHVQARQLLQLGGAVVLLYVDGGTLMSNPVEDTNLLMDFRQNVSGSWLPLEGGATKTPPAVFATNAVFDVDDWTATVQGGAVHAVRRVGSVFEHRIMTTPGTSAAAWSNGAIIPLSPTLPASGLFLAPYGTGLVLLALAADAGSVLYTVFDGAAWSAWSVLANTNGGADYLSGYAPGGGVKPAVVWTQTAGSSYSISGLQLP